MRTNAVVEITCELLEDPENGRVIQPSRIAGAVARYECNPGFTLVGTETRTCSASGIWSGEAPVCIGESMSLIRCLSLQSCVPGRWLRLALTNGNIWNGARNLVNQHSYTLTGILFLMNLPFLVAISHYMSIVMHILESFCTGEDLI